MSVNKVILIGNVGKMPEVRHLEGGKVAATISVATTEKGYTLQSGIVVPEKVEWHTVVFWGGLAEVVEKYIDKGSQIYVEGKIRTRSWEKEGVKQFKTEVMGESMQMLGKRSENASQTPQTASQEGLCNPIKVDMPVSAPKIIDDMGGDLPF